MLALVQLFTAALLDVTVERNTVVPVEIPDKGLVIVRDGDPGDPDQVLGGFQNAYYEHQVEIEIFVQDADSAQREQKYTSLVRDIGAALATDETLNGQVHGMTYGYPTPQTTEIDGGQDIKSAVLDVVIEYDTATPLS